MCSNSANRLATEMPYLFIIIGILDGYFKFIHDSYGKLYWYFFDGVETELAHHARAATSDSDGSRRV